jgi:broad specificity phosphatase PhoE
VTYRKDAVAVADSEQTSAGGARTTALLIRHAQTDAAGMRLAGREPGVRLNSDGILQAARLGRALADHIELAAIYSSPLERALETAHALARYQAAGVVHEDENLLEVDFGSWTGHSFVELEADPAWTRFNRSRANATIPGGEQIIDVQHRVIRTIHQLCARYAGQTIALVSHAEPIRVAVLHYRGMSLDLFHEVEINPASVTALSFASAGARLLFVNDTRFARSAPISPPD